jgi:hypothetical protein
MKNEKIPRKKNDRDYTNNQPNSFFQARHKKKKTPAVEFLRNMPALISYHS